MSESSVQSIPIVESNMEASSTPKGSFGFFTSKKNLVIAVTAILILGGLFLIWQNFQGSGKGQFEDFYTLVPDKISKSASVAIRLPEGVRLNVAQASSAISFEPKIEGSWKGGKSAEYLLFQPARTLDLGKHYSVTLSANQIKIKKDFLVDEDPKVISIFPAADSEASENSKITIIFNRPMVPLTVLDELSYTDIPVEILPHTEGKFKWSTTRNLQFIPDVRLVRSATYQVKIKSGFVSMDGLPVSSLEHKFTTRPLRYKIKSEVPGPFLLSSQAILYNQPIRIFFNQPIDLKKTAEEVTIANKNGGSVPFVVSYGTRSVYDEKDKKYNDYSDKSILEIHNQADRFGRKKFWDFNSYYPYSLRRAYPLEGDVILEEPTAGLVYMGEIISEVSAESPRTKFAEPDIFDPQGKLWISFFEDIDKDKSLIDAPHLRGIGYGEKCKEPEVGQVVLYGNDCEKIEDHKKLYLVFDPNAFKPGEEVKIHLRKIYSQSGLQINPEEIMKIARVYPNLEIYKTVPEERAIGADLTKMKICTSNPLLVPDEKTFYDAVKSNVTVGLWNWYPPFRVRSQDTHAACAVGQFENTIRFGLVPEFPYNIDLNLLDDFGQSASQTVRFTSGKLANASRRITQLQKGYNVTSPDRLKLSYATDNLEYVNLSICAVTPETMLEYIEARPVPQASPSSLRCVKTIERLVPLPKKYWSRSYFQINLADYLPSPIGHYVLSLGHPEYRDVVEEWDSARQSYVERVGGPRYERTFITVTELAVQEKKVAWTDSLYFKNQEVVQEAMQIPKNLYWVSQFGTLNPVEGALVDVYRYIGKDEYKLNRQISFLATFNTGSDGVALADVSQNVVGAIVKKGADSAIVAERMDRLQWASAAQPSERTYLYTDKPIYRPGQEVHIKGIYRLGYDNEYEIFQGKQINLKIRNSKYEDISEKELELSEYGTFSTDLTLDQNSPLGTYSVSVPGGTAYFDVEEYVPAAFRLEIAPEKEEYIAGDIAKLSLNANYYFGVPVDGGTVEYSISSQDYYFDRYQDDYFQFGSGWYYSFDGSYGDRFFTRGKTVLDSHGKGQIEESLDFAKLFKDESGFRSKIFTVQVTAKNKLGQSISTRKSFIVHRGKIYTGVSLDKNFSGKNESITARIKTVDTKGQEISVSRILVEIKKITWETFKRREVDGRYYFTSKEKKETVDKFTVHTDSKGSASQEFKVREEGIYQVSLTSSDDRGNTVTSHTDLYIHGSGSVSIRPTNNETLDLATDKQKVDVGEEVKIVIKSPFPRGKALVSMERGKIFEYHIVDVDRSLVDFNFRVKDEYVPNVYVTVLLLSPRPEIKYGQINYTINVKERELTIEARSDKNNYLPGEKVNLDFLVKDRQGNPVSSELSVAVVDMSVLALKGNPKKNPVTFFYNGTPLMVSTQSNVKNILFEADIPTGTKGGGGSEELAKKKRGEFRDTALWQAVLRTNREGRAHVSFVLPDNLTEWQVESLGVTKNTTLGTGYREFKTQKELMIVPLKPRFVVPGDEFYIGGQTFNNTDHDLTAEVSIASDTLSLKGKKSVSLSLKKHSSGSIYFSAEAPKEMQSGKHILVLRAKAPGLEDTVENSISITRNDTYESTATAAYSTNLQSREYIYLPPNVVADRGGLSIKSSATLAVFLSDALRYLVEYPYGASEQIASKLSSLAILKRGLNLKNIGDTFELKEVEFEGNTYTIDDLARIGLARVYENQATDGGFAYYKSMKPNIYLSIHVLNALTDLKNAGYEVGQVRYLKAAQFIYFTLTQDALLTQNKDLVILVAYALSRVENFPALNDRVASIAGDQQYIHEKISNESLAYLAILLTQNYPADLKERVFQELENRIVIDSRGAHLSLAGKIPIYQFYETPIKDTALLLKAFAKDKRESLILDKVLRWILASRAKDGAWGSTNNTVTVIDGLTEFFLWKKEFESSFDLSLSIDDKPLGSFNFGKDSILKTFEKFLSVAEIGLGKMRTVKFTKTAKNNTPNNYYYDMLLKYYLPIEKVMPRDEGFSVSREFYLTDDVARKKPLEKVAQGEVLNGHLVITVPEARNFVAIEDFIPAGMEIVNLSLATEDQTLEVSGNKRPLPNFISSRNRAVSPEPRTDSEGVYYNVEKNIFSWSGILESIRSFFSNSSLPHIGGGSDLPDEFYGHAEKVVAFLNPDSSETHDDRLLLFKERLLPGVYEYDYYVRALVPGTFHHLPAIASEMYFPENFGRTRGKIFSISEKD